MTDETQWWREVVTPALLRHARGAYGRSMRRSLEAAGFDDIPGNGLYLIGGLALGEVEHPAADLLREMRLSSEAGGRLLDALVLRGYLERRPDPVDPARTLVALTDRGRAAAAIQAGARESVDAELVERCGPDTVQAMRRGLAALVEIASSVPDAEARD